MKVPSFCSIGTAILVLLVVAAPKCVHASDQSLANERDGNLRHKLNPVQATKADMKMKAFEDPHRELKPVYVEKPSVIEDAGAGKEAVKPASMPASAPVTKPASEPVSKPASKTVSKPASEPVSKQANEPASKDDSKLASEPASKTSSNQPANQQANQSENQPVKHDDSSDDSSVDSSDDGKDDSKDDSEAASQVDLQDDSEDDAKQDTKAASKDDSQDSSNQDTTPANQEDSQDDSSTEDGSQDDSQEDSSQAISKTDLVKTRICSKCKNYFSLFSETTTFATNYESLFRSARNKCQSCLRKMDDHSDTLTHFDGDESLVVSILETFRVEEFFTRMVSLSKLGFDGKVAMWGEDSEDDSEDDAKQDTKAASKDDSQDNSNQDTTPANQEDSQDDSSTEDGSQDDSQEDSSQAISREDLVKTRVCSKCKNDFSLFSETTIFTIKHESLFGRARILCSSCLSKMDDHSDTLTHFDGDEGLVVSILETLGVEEFFTRTVSLSKLGFDGQVAMWGEDSEAAQLYRTRAQCRECYSILEVFLSESKTETMRSGSEACSFCLMFVDDHAEVEEVFEGNTEFVQSIFDEFGHSYWFPERGVSASGLGFEVMSEKGKRRTISLCQTCKESFSKSSDTSEFANDYRLLFRVAADQCTVCLSRMEDHADTLSHLDGDEGLVVSILEVVEANGRPHEISLSKLGFEEKVAWGAMFGSEVAQRTHRAYLCQLCYVIFEAFLLSVDNGWTKPGAPDTMDCEDCVEGLIDNAEATKFYGDTGVAQLQDKYGEYESKVLVGESPSDLGLSRIDPSDFGLGG
ncbi:expressed unknown protein [Seminavis robusta]|uniref:Uncharacterized protein n=1 Tax=Seminavis robusta TaxID=568900 RepID=A0A9N8EPT4_9STRA|nr:expressed unknown protein [Seminavis robusta]|eukprot:Sro1472_g275480.1 n/a (807) ;mRNA; f:6369-9159